MTQKFIRLVKLPKGPGQKLVGLVFPVLSGHLRDDYKESYGELDEENKFYIAGSSFIDGVLSQKDGKEILESYTLTFSIFDSGSLISFNKHECEEVNF